MNHTDGEFTLDRHRSWRDGELVCTEPNRELTLWYPDPYLTMNSQSHFDDGPHVIKVSGPHPAIKQGTQTR